MSLQKDVYIAYTHTHTRVNIK